MLHQGINKCLQKEREFVFWADYMKDITEVIEKYIPYQENSEVISVHIKCTTLTLAHTSQTLIRSILLQETVGGKLFL